MRKANFQASPIGHGLLRVDRQIGNDLVQLGEVGFDDMLRQEERRLRPKDDREALGEGN